MAKQEEAWLWMRKVKIRRTGAPWVGAWMMRDIYTPVQWLMCWMHMHIIPPKGCYVGIRANRSFKCVAHVVSWQRFERECCKSRTGGGGRCRRVVLGRVAMGV